MKRMLIPVLLAAATPSAAAQRSETAVLAGGCFWGMEWVFEHVKGVTAVTSGYAGGSAADAHYDRVSTEATGHAEAVRITYDPAQISYGKLLQIYFTVAHDPTEVNRQGPDVGPSYRSAIFPQSAAQSKAAQVFIDRLNATHAFRKSLATRIERGTFYPAEAYHQQFAEKHPSYPYIVVNDRPKLALLRRKFPALYKG